MNQPYPINGSPFVQSPLHHNSPQGPTHNGANHPHPHYTYPPMQPHYPAHPYHAYPSYPPHPMMAYTPPPAPAQAQAPPQPTTPISAVSASSSKRKRKSTIDSAKSKGSEKASDNEEPGVSGNDTLRWVRSTNGTPLVDMHKKRTKTQRACDSCRSRKIRCDVLTEADPPLCQHCKQYGFECTFFLPITETRFKKKRQEEEAAAAAAAEKDKPSEAESSQQLSPNPEGPKGEVRIFGPTSMTHLLHSTATVPSRAYQSYDLRYHHTWEVSKTGDGFIQVLEPDRAEDANASLPMPVDLRVERDVIEKLINSYFTDVGQLVPIVTQAEFLSDPSPPPILLYSICLVAAAKREVPQSVFDSLRIAVNNVIKSEDVISNVSIVNVQSLLILCLCGDSHSQHPPTALSALWIRLGVAIRMAQDLGLHRAEAVKQNIERRRRIWAACLISDRWTSLTFGHPSMIDVEDCDARLPSSGDPNDQYMDELVRLSIILGRVLKTIYTPSGLTHATDEKLEQLFSDMKAWRDRLPDDLKFRGPQTPRNGGRPGLLHMLYTSVTMIFWRVFMRISYTCPDHLKFGLTVERWTELVNMTGDAIDWLDLNERLYDVWIVVAYCATSCALVQYHTWARRKDPDAQVKLRKLRDCVRRWEASLQPEHMSARRKTAEIITLLYEATQGPINIDEPPLLNPTGGVRVKRPLGGLIYKKDLSRPGGGFFVAKGQAKKMGDYSNMPAGVVVTASGSEDSEGEEQPAEASSSRPTNDAAVPLSSSASGSGSGHALADVSPSTRRAVPANVGSPTASVVPQPSGSATMVNYQPLGNFANSNVNPSLNDRMVGTADVQVLNVLDVPQAPNTVEQFAVADTGLLEGIPGSMFDWPQWETFFSRFNVPTDPNGLYAQGANAPHPQPEPSHANYQ
ncbi:hypothetical protein BD410DRAFT_714522 [Rickenella mellea]|uniref:Zn(2)-C6 fungal-type domain-containing protein n=1 Tax=Rickenella mellea TaxID=50990 RepID=A0A4Y7QKK0_9AGAM|nr:hypothetical protein BD410DRAFT_714522 [Rickenella mellea]